MSGLTDQEILQRYRTNYGLGEEIGLEHVRQHEALERKLTASLLESSPEQRWDVFSKAYTELYQSLPWLNVSVAEPDAPPVYLSCWARLLPKAAKVFEIGSGKAVLLRYLSSLGHRCVATEITKERGSKHLPVADGLEWRQTDGVNLTRFEPANSYDVVISTQVMEHFHPDDVLTHFENARAILAKGGSYIFDTPHVSTGPHDLSRVFDEDRAIYMHLKEYSFREIGRLLEQAGFRSVKAVFCIKKMGATGPLRKSRLFFLYCCAWDWLEEKLGLNPNQRRKLRGLLRLVFVPSNIWIAAEK